jgi:hypothetical protein
VRHRGACVPCPFPFFLLKALAARAARDSKNDLLAKENATKLLNPEFAMDSVVKANLTVKFLACLQVCAQMGRTF